MHYYALQFIGGQNFADVIRQLRRDAGMVDANSADDVPEHGTGERTASELRSDSSTPQWPAIGEEPWNQSTLLESGPPQALLAAMNKRKAAVEFSANHQRPTLNARAGTTVKSQRDKNHFRSVAQRIAHAADALEYVTVNAASNR